MSFCKCNSGQENLGVLGCPRTLKSVKKHIRVPIFDNEGKRNSIKLSDLVGGKLTDAYILGKLTEADADKKWYLTPKYESVEASRTESSYDEFPSGLKFKIDTGVREFMGVIPEADAQLAGKMNGGACSLIGHFEIDTEGSIKGEMSADGSELFPLQVSKGSFEAVEIEAVEGSSVQRIQVSFQYAKTINEAQLRIVNFETIEADLLDINGALSANIGLQGSASSSKATVSLSIADYGYFGETIPVEGQTNVAAWSVVDSAGIVSTPSDVVEIADGTYELTLSDIAIGSATIKYIGAPSSSAEQLYSAPDLSAGISDGTVPVITLIGASTEGVALNSTFTDDGATALDSVDGDITGNIVTVNTVDSSIVGIYSVTYNVSDAAGNAAVEVVRLVEGS